MPNMTNMTDLNPLVESFPAVYLMACFITAAILFIAICAVIAGGKQ